MSRGREQAHLINYALIVVQLKKNWSSTKYLVVPRVSAQLGASWTVALMTTVPRPFSTVKIYILGHNSSTKGGTLRVLRALLPLGWRRTTTQSKQFLRSTLRCERSTVGEQNSVRRR